MKLLLSVSCVLIGLFINLSASNELLAQKLSTKSKKAVSLYKTASSLYASSKFELAKEPLNQAIKKDPDFLEAYLLLSEVCYEQEEYGNQAQLLEKVIQIDSTFYIQCYYNLGVANFNLDNFEVAVKWFEKYYSKTKSKRSKEKVENWLKKVQFAKEVKENPKHINAENLGPLVNTINNEYWPSITADDKVLVYTVLVPRDSTVNNSQFSPAMVNYYHEDFYRTIKDRNGEWGQSERLLPPINSSSNEGAQSLSADGNWMFFTACGRKDSKGSCDIYFSYRTQNGWSYPKNIGSPVNTPFWESQPSFSSDGKTLYYSSNRSGGIGGNDIWRAEIIGVKPDGTPYFSQPENLGDKINTASNEVSPYIHHDNRSLYFSSSGWPGLGKMDIFLSRMNDAGKFTIPENLGYPINSSGDDVGLVVTSDGTKAYFSSERFEKSYGGKDLYSFEMPQEIKPLPVSYIKGRVFDIKTKKQLQAAFELKDLQSRKLIVEANSTDFSGEFLICLPIAGSYALNVSKKGYLFYSDHFDMKSESSVTDPMVLDVYLKPIEIGEQVILNNVFFETDSYLLKPESEIELEKVVSFLNVNEKVHVELIGYTDNVGTEDYNIELSRKRAQQVYQYIIDKGILPQRVSYSGKGMKDAIATNDTDAGRAKNRRTELKIIE